jgi:acetylornithine deacetylase/succinyl-diaminopimelate desuccinylase-like protein
VLRPSTSLQLALRLPPGVDAHARYLELKQVFETNPPHGATVIFEGDGASGWDAPALAPWLEAALEETSRRHFGKPSASIGEGGSIPFIGMLGERFPEAQFMIAGVLGPESNAHGPNEFLHIPTAKRLTACVADVIGAHAGR